MKRYIGQDWHTDDVGPVQFNTTYLSHLARYDIITSHVEQESGGINALSLQLRKCCSHRCICRGFPLLLVFLRIFLLRPD